MSDLTGTIPCEEACEIPEGVTLSPVPRPRHAWGDVLVCPHEGCDRAFLIVSKPEESHAQPQ